MRLYGSFQIGKQGPESVEIDLCSVRPYHGLGENLLAIVGTGVEFALAGVECLSPQNGQRVIAQIAVSIILLSAQLISLLALLHHKVNGGAVEVVVFPPTEAFPTAAARRCCHDRLRFPEPVARLEDIIRSRASDNYFLCADHSGNLILTERGGGRQRFSGANIRKG